jgi:hypothetical protein
MDINAKYKFSNQAVGAIMMALQKGILEQTDITYILKDFEILNSVDGLIVNNPPTVTAAQESDIKTEPAKKVRKKRTTKKRVTKKRTTAKKKKEDA